MLDTLAQCYRSVEATGRILFPEHFACPETALHKQINDFLDDDSKKKIVISAPRGIGKTTTMSIAKCAQAILFDRYNFICYVSNSADSAQRQTDNLKRELLSNSTVRQLWGSIKPEAVEGMDESFSKISWVGQNPLTGHKTYVLPRGSGQQIRGLKYGAKRPDLLIFDDLEETNLLFSEEQRKKLKDWFFSDAMECVDQRDGAVNKVIYIDTLKHEDSLLAELLELDDWHHLRLSICDESYNSYAPEFKSTKRILKMVESARKSGTLDHFYREHMSEPISHEDASFKAEYFKYYSEIEERLTQDPDIESFVIVDPAKTAKATSAFSAVVGVSVNLRSNAIYVRDLVMERLERDDLMNEALNMACRLKAVVLGVEITGLDQWIEQPFRDEISRRALALNFVPLHAKRGKGELGHEGGKVGRIAGLIPYYRQGLIYHNENVTGPLEAQLRSFPRAKRWDAMDALAYILELLDYGERYFWPQRASEPGYDVEAEYAEIEAERYLPDMELPDITGSDLYSADWSTV